MTIWEAIILGVLQGLTEFLPVSSSGHLELANYIFGIEEPSNLQFTMMLHAGTVLSTIVVFWGEIVKLTKGFFKFKLNQETIFIINILISLIPIALVGLLFKEQIEGLYTNNIILVGAMMLVTAILLTVAQRTKPKMRPMTAKRAFIIGVAQSVAIFPGLSRSGTTISTGLMLGVRREEVAKFSFLMVLIPIIGMNLLEIVKTPPTAAAIEQGVPILHSIVGFMTAFVVGTVACRWMIKMVSRGRLIWFAIYCALVGSSAIIMGLLQN